MCKCFVVLIAITAAVLVFPAAAHAVLIWDTVAGDGAVVTDGSGDWYNGSTTWNDGVGNVAWDNSNPAIAQFGTSLASTAVAVGVTEAVKTLGIVSYKKYTFNPVVDSYIELQGTSPSIVTWYQTYFNVSLKTASGVETLQVTGAGASSSRYLWLMGANTFDAPMVVGSDDNGLLAMQYHDDALDGLSTAGITVKAGSTLRFGAPLMTDKSFTIAGTGFGGRGALMFYGDVAGTRLDGRNLTGSATLAADATIKLGGEDTISGQISGDYALTLNNAYTGGTIPGIIHLTNGANSTKNLVITSNGQPVTVHLDANYAATESVTIGTADVVKSSTLKVNAPAYLSTPLISLNSSAAVLDASAAGLTLAGGTTLTGVGAVQGDVAAAAGSTIAPGISAGTLIFANAVDLSAGGNMTWELAALKDDAGGGVAGTDFDLATIAGNLTLGGASQLTLDFVAVGDPSPSETFWTSNHSWKIIDVGDSGVTTGDFSLVVNGTFAAGTFDTSVVSNDVLLNFTAGAVVVIPGDANYSGTVDAADAAILAQHWGATGDGVAWAQGDFNADHAVNAADASIMAANWSASGGEGASVPEPGVLALLGAAAAFLASCRLRRL